MEFNEEEFNGISNADYTDSQNLSLFIISLFEVFDESKIIHKGKCLNNYSFSMHGGEVFPLIVFKPDSISDIKILLKLAKRHRTEIHVISRGKNYGYGSAQGTNEGQVILDLSHFNKIKELNEDLGYIQIESGVSQSQLSQYLINSKSNFQTDVTGAGLDASVLGNILERGFGHTDYGNRIDSLINLTVLLPTGQIIKTGSLDYPNSRASNVYPYGMGPDLRGLFTQSNFGIVLEGTIKLQKKPDYFSMLIIFFENDSSLGAIVDIVRKLKQEGIITSTVHIANKARLKKPNAENKAGAWNLSTSLSGSKSIVKLKKKMIIRRLKKAGKMKSFWVTDNRLLLLEKIGAYSKKLRPLYETVQDAVNLKKGIPTESYIKDLVQDDKASSLNLSSLRLKQGFRWISSVSPATSNDVEKMITLARNYLTNKGYLFRSTLTFINNSSVILITEINFDLDKQETAKADYQDCVHLLKEYGFYSYRGGNGSYDSVMPDSSASYDLLREIKNIVDPNNILSPGKYKI